jgi:hypothetical protein
VHEPHVRANIFRLSLPKALSNEAKFPRNRVRKALQPRVGLVEHTPRSSPEKKHLGRARALLGQTWLLVVVKHARIC